MWIKCSNVHYRLLFRFLFERFLMKNKNLFCGHFNWSNLTQGTEMYYENNRGWNGFEDYQNNRFDLFNRVLFHTSSIWI